MADMTESIAPRSDQMNAEDLLAGPRTFTITDVRVSVNPDQPVSVYLDEFPKDRPFKPSKTVRRLLVVAWGPDSAAYIGKRLTLYRDPTVRFGGQDVGGIRVSHMSDIPATFTVQLATTRGRRAPYVVEPLTGAPPAAPGDPRRVDRMLAALAGVGVTEEAVTEKLGRPRAAWSGDDVDRMAAVFRAMTAGEVTREEAFPRSTVSVDDLPPDPGPPLQPEGATEPAANPGPTVQGLLDQLGVRQGEDRYALVSLYVGRQTTQHDLTDAEYETVLAALSTIAGQDDEGRAADLDRDLREARQLAAERTEQ